MKPLKIAETLELTGCFIAGGAVLSHATKTEINDYDIYPKSEKSFEDLVTGLVESNGCFVLNISDKAITLKCNAETNKNGERIIIQIMFSDGFYPTPESIFEKFDFTVCMGAFDCDTKEYFFHKDFYPDIASKTLRFNTGTLYPLNSLLRTTKYKEKGYYISKPEFMKIAFAAMHKGMPASWEELEEQIGGSYGKQISIASNDLEYNYENLIRLLSEMDCDEFSLKDDSENYSQLPIDIVVSACLGREIPIVKVGDNYALLGEDGHIRDAHFSSEFELLEKFATIVDPDKEIYVIVTSTKRLDGKYVIGGETIETVDGTTVEFSGNYHAYINSGSLWERNITKILATVKAKDILELSSFSVGIRNCELVELIQ